MTDNNEKFFYKMGSVAAWMQLAITLAIIVISFTLGTEPKTAEEYFSLYQNDRITALLRDDFSSLLIIALYLALFPALYLAVRRVNRLAAAFIITLVFIGVTCSFITHSGFSLIHLSDRYAAASDPAQKTQLLAAAEAVIAANIWNSTGGYMTGILLQGGGVLISILMLRSRQFNKLTVYAGLLANALDLAQHILHPFVPSLSSSIMLAAGPFYLVWFPMLARDLFRLGKRQPEE